ncbi:MAG: uroporphyrinogen-III synthase [Cyclonatronaceae bacterium]
MQAAPQVWFTRSLPPDDVQLLRQNGIEPLVHPLIEIELRPVLQILEASKQLPPPDALLFTSKNAVDAFVSCLAVRPGWLGDIPLYAVGNATAHRLLQGTGRRAHTPPDEQQDGSGVAGLLIQEQQPGARVWHFSGNKTRPEAPAALQSAGLMYDAITTYYTVLKKQVNAPRETFYGVAFYSPSAVEAFIINDISLPENCRIAAIGRTTKAALQQHGFEDVLVPEIPDTLALAEALLNEFELSR